MTVSDKFYSIRSTLRLYAWKNAITITLMAVAFIITWIVIIITAVLNG